VERFRLLGLYVVFIVVVLACAIGAVAVHRVPSGAPREAPAPLGSALPRPGMYRAA